MPSASSENWAAHRASSFSPTPSRAVNSAKYLFIGTAVAYAAISAGEFNFYAGMRPQGAGPGSRITVGAALFSI